MRRVDLLHAHGSPTGYLYTKSSCRCVACRGARSDRGHKYYAEHSEEEAERGRIYRAEHIEEKAEHDRRYRAEHPGKNADRCREYQADHAEEIAEYKLQQKYGISTAEKGELLANQGGCCAICRTNQPGGRWPSWPTDHDHKTGKVRGILCNRCNHGLGKFRDDPKILMAAIEYLAAATL